MIIAFNLSIIVILLGIITYILFIRKKKNIKYNIFLALLISILALTFLIFPLEDNYNNVFTRILASFFYAIKCAGMGEDLDILSKIDISNSFGLMYFTLINFLFIIMPLMTVGFITTFIENIIIRLNMLLSKKNQLHIFSEVNEKTLLIAKQLQNKKNTKIIFTNVLDKSKIKIKSILTKDKITNLNLEKNTNNITFYILNEDEENNLNITLELIDKYKNRNKTKIYILNNSSNTSTILDSTNKGKVSVELINEKERAIFNLLNNKSLFTNTINNTISILIVGCGNLGKEFLKNITWCGMIDGYSLKTLVIDTKADQIKENIEIEAPELLNNYDITFINADIKSRLSLDAIKKRNDINYILVSMDNDDKNLETSILLRRLFLREFNREPLINLWISNKYKQEQITSIVNEKKNSYNLNAFGSIEELYYDNNIVNSNLEKLAIKIHLSYNPNDTNLEQYNLLEYNKRSSRATALHIKYKLFSILKDKYTSDMKENQKIFNELYNSKIEDILTKNEHDRWNAYMRSIGYITSSIEDVKKYYTTTNNYINYLARKHPAIVEFSKLDEVSKELSKICNKKINLVDSDRQIIKNIHEKIKI